MVYHKIQKFNNKKIILFSWLVIASLVFIYGVKPLVQGQSVSELEKQRQEKQQKLSEVTKRISQLQSEIKERKAVANSLKNEIALVDLEIAETEAQIEATNTKIDATNLDIADTTNQIIQTEEDIKKQKVILKNLIAEINDLDQMSPLEVALENDNFTEFLDRLQYSTSIQERSQEALTKIKVLKSNLEQKNVELKKQKADLDSLKGQLVIAEAGLVGQRAAKQKILDQTRGQERVYQKLLSESEGLEDQIQQEIYDLEVELRKQLGNNKLPPKKGLMMWPMDGVLTQAYGNTGFTKLGYTFHNGLDIAAPAGTRIYAVLDGTVQDTGTGQGAYGNWVTIKHTVSGRQLITLYGHMSSFKVKRGQAVKTGDLVGFEGNTGNTTRLLYGPHRGYHIHFTVFDGGTYGVSAGKYSKTFGTYDVPYGATYNPMDFL